MVKENYWSSPNVRPPPETLDSSNIDTTTANSCIIINEK
jgi:hypothetical protein